jgi:hypothetical protein
MISFLIDFFCNILLFIVVGIVVIGSLYETISFLKFYFNDDNCRRIFTKEKKSTLPNNSNNNANVNSENGRKKQEQSPTSSLW